MFNGWAAGGGTTPMAKDRTNSDGIVIAGISFPRLHDWRERHRDAGLSVILALQVTVMFVIAPLAGASPFTSETVEALRFALAAIAVLMVTRHLMLGAAVALTFTVSLASIIALHNGVAGDATLTLSLSLTIAFDLAVSVTVAHAAFGAGRINVHRILGAVILYLYIGLIFASVYRLAALYLHPAFTGLSRTQSGNLGELLYFSLSSLTTEGFGDIAPVHPFLRSLANLEAIIGQLYPATFLARLVTLVGTVTDRPSGDSKD
jgi:hypothetical protein